MKNTLFKWAARFFVPDVAAHMAQEGTMTTDAPSGPDEQYMVVEDNGSDVTVVCWAGMAVLFAGMPAFEFRKLLVGEGNHFNLIFFRDVRRMGYMEKPDGSDGGVEFYAQKCTEAMERLGSKYHICIGASAGASSAFYFGSLLKMDHIIAFSPVFRADVYTSWKQQLSHYFNIKLMLTEPQAWLEVVGMMLGSHVVAWKFYQRFGPDCIRDVLGTFREANPRPKATVFHGDHCLPDRVQAHLLDGFAEVEYAPVKTGRHNVAAILKREGKLASAIIGTIHRGLEERGWEIPGKVPQTELVESAQ